MMVLMGPPSTEELVKLYKREANKVFSEIDDHAITKFVHMIIDAYEAGAKVYACGNGGNAAFVGNLITDLNMHPFVSEDKSTPMVVPKRLHAINLCESGSSITAIMNDIGPEHIFSEQLRFGGGSGDLLIGITGSGTSKNIVQAIKTAKEIGMKTIAIAKFSDTPAIELADHGIVIAGNSNFPGQTGGNNNNFHFEDCVGKLSHIATGLLKRRVVRAFGAEA